MTRLRIHERSEFYWSRARKIIPAGTQTLSKGPTQYVNGVAPKYLRAGKGCRVWDVDGNEYIDYGMGLHPIILGYCYPAVDEAIRKQLEEGITFTLMHPLEVEVAEQLIELIPCAEAVRFGKNGSDVTAAAVRAARAYTGRDKVACCGYHGWQDWYIGSTEHHRGVPKVVRGLTLVFEYNSIESLERLFREHAGEIAAVIMEPVGVEAPRDGFLEQVRDLTHRNGALLIFDEIITGFRFSLGGAQEFFGVVPDMATFGKCMANGMPVSALVGRREVMEVFNEVFFSCTFGGECLSLAAAKATMQELQNRNVLSFVWRQGEKLQQGFNKLVQEAGLGDRVQCVGYPCRTVIRFTDEHGNESLLMKSLFQQEVLKRGILWAGYHAISFSHGDEEIERTLEAFGEALGVLVEALEAGDVARYLEGPPVQPVFRRV